MAIYTTKPVEPVIKINRTLIGEGEPVYMIAEIGINHNSSMEITKRLIDAAFATRWDCVKFQKRNPDVCVPEDQKDLPKKTPWGDMTYLAYKHKMEFGLSEYDEINNYCWCKPMSWAASVWDLDSIDFLQRYNVPFIKIPSAKLTDESLIMSAMHSEKPIILSTGMSTLEEIDNAVNLLKFNQTGFAIMHCNSSYPSPPGELNLNVIPFLKDRYGCVVGYSGHEYGLDPSVVAVALGADIIERHITLDHTMWGTDQAASLEVHAMDMLRKRITEVRTCLGDGVKSVTESEQPIREKLRG